MPELTLKQVMQVLRILERSNRWFFSIQNICVITGRKNDISLRNDLEYYIDADMLEYVGNDIYAFRIFSMIPFNSQEIITHSLRPNCLNYISFEYALNQYGIISQIPTVLTVATTGASEWISSKSYNIEFIHVNHSFSEIMDNCRYSEAREILVASPAFALKDLENQNRNLHLLQYDEVEEAQQYYENS